MLTALAALVLVAGGCAEGDGATAGPTIEAGATTTTEPVAAAGTEPEADGPGEPPLVVATTTIWADVTRNVACDGLAEVVSVMPVGADSHTFEPSLADRGRLEEASLVVANGFDLEEGLLDTLAAVEAAGTPVFRVAEHVPEPLHYGPGPGHGHDHADDAHGHGDEGHAHGEDAHGHGEDAHGHGEDAHGHGEDAHGHGEDAHGHGDDGHGHVHVGEDPHVWFDPQRVAAALDPLAGALVDEAGLDAEAVAACLEDYQDQLAAVDAELSEIVAAVPAERRRLVTNHHAFAYFADRYGFEVVGTVLPAATTLAETNPAALEALARTIEEYGVPAIFTEVAISDRDAQALADRVGHEVRVIALFTESLGEAGSGADTYLDMLRANAQLIADGLSGA
jgi:ABC-type Zn uptake system ZnuABC Zn-binding protein ZnuA